MPTRVPGKRRGKEASLLPGRARREAFFITTTGREGHRRADGSFIFSEPPAGLANARVRAWWQKAIAGEEYVSGVYLSAITRRPCRTLSLPIRDSRGTILGVLAADVSAGPLPEG